MPPNPLQQVLGAPMQLQSVIQTLQQLAQAITALNTNLLAAVSNIANKNG